METNQFETLMLAITGLKSNMDNRFDQVDKKFVQIDQRFDQVDQKFVQIDQRFEQIDQRFAQIDKRFDQIDKNYAISDKKLELIAQQTAKTVSEVGDIKARVSRLEGPAA